MDEEKISEVYRKLRLLDYDTLYDIYKSVMKEIPSGKVGIKNVGKLWQIADTIRQLADKHEDFVTIAAKVLRLTVELPQPFADGNKAVGYHYASLILRMFGYELVAEKEDVYKLLWKIPSIPDKELEKWIRSHLRLR